MSAPEKEAKPPQDKEARARLESVKELMRLMGNAARIFRSYPSNNQIYIDFSRQLGEKFLAHLANYGALVLSVGQYEFTFDGKDVYSEANPSRNLALKLYRDGVRRIRLLEGLEKEEILDFVEALSEPLDAEDLEDDVVTRLWEKDLLHVKYAVLDEIPAGEKGAGEGGEEGAPSGEGGVAGRQKTWSTAHIKMEYKEVRSQLRELAEEIKNAVSSVNGASLQRLQKQAGEVMKKDIASHIGLVLFNAVATEKDPELSTNAVDVLGHLLRASIAKGDLKGAANLLARLKDLCDPELGLSPLEVEKARGKLRALGKEDVLLQLAAVADENIPERDQQLREFLMAWAEHGIGAVISLAGLAKRNQTIVEVLFELARQHPERCVEGLQNPNPLSVAAALRALASTGDARFAGHLRVCLKNPSPQVKIEAVRTLEKLKGAQALELLGTLLDDEDLSVRRAAAAAIGGLGGSRAIEILQGRVLQKTFINNEMEEKRVLLGALAEAGGPDSVPILASILKRKRFFRAERQNESRACAAQALSVTGNSEAVSILEKFRNDRSVTVRAACRAALSRIGAQKKEKSSNA